MEKYLKIKTKDNKQYNIIIQAHHHYEMIKHCFQGYINIHITSSDETKFNIYLCSLEILEINEIMYPLSTENYTNVIVLNY